MNDIRYNELTLSDGLILLGLAVNAANLQTGNLWALVMKVTVSSARNAPTSD